MTFGTRELIMLRWHFRPGAHAAVLSGVFCTQDGHRCWRTQQWTVVGLMWPPKRYVHPEPMNGTVFGKTVFAGVIKDLEMVPAYVKLGPESS